LKVITYFTQILAMESAQHFKNRSWLSIHVLLSLIILVSYSIFFWMDSETIYALGYEDGFFEYLTAILFFLASILMLALAVQKRNWWFAGLFILLFVGAGEEISWGQRLLGIETPEELKNVNVQGEITLHNLELFNRENFDKSVKTGWQKFLTINTVYRVFIMIYGVVFPVIALFSPFILSFFQRIKIPIINARIGIYFFFSWIAFRVMNICYLGADDFFAAEEIFECLTGWVWFFAAIDFLMNLKKQEMKTKI
jgi:hypothetical protein